MLRRLPAGGAPIAIVSVSQPLVVRTLKGRCASIMPTRAAVRFFAAICPGEPAIEGRVPFMMIRCQFRSVPLVTGLDRARFVGAPVVPTAMIAYGSLDWFRPSLAIARTTCLCVASPVRLVAVALGVEAALWQGITTSIVFWSPPCGLVGADAPLSITMRIPASVRRTIATGLAALLRLLAFMGFRESGSGNGEIANRQQTKSSTHGAHLPGA